MEWLSLAVCCGCLVVLLSVNGAEGLKCYQCVHTGCEDDFNKNNNGVSTMDCNGSCSKAKIGSSVTRSCLPMLKKDDCEEKDDKAVCFCTGNLCNGGTSVTIPAFLMGILAVVPGLLIKL